METFSAFSLREVMIFKHNLEIGSPAGDQSIFLHFQLFWLLFS